MANGTDVFRLDGTVRNGNVTVFMPPTVYGNIRAIPTFRVYWLYDLLLHYFSCVGHMFVNSSDDIIANYGPLRPNQIVLSCM